VGGTTGLVGMMTSVGLEMTASVKTQVPVVGVTT
jgi:hypothetical protein